MDELEEIRKRKLKELVEKMNKKVIDVSSVDEAVERSKGGLVLVDCWAPWCIPCKVIGPILERMSNKFGFTLAKLNTDNHPEEAERLGVRGIPTVFFVKGGKVVDSFVGVRDLPYIEAKVRKHL